VRTQVYRLRLNPNGVACSKKCGGELAWQTRGRESVAERFWRHVDTSTGQGPKGDCWEWSGARYPEGYGQLGVRANGFKSNRAHVTSYELHYGPVPEGAHILHSCDNRPCVNPEHLRAGTAAENGHDRVLRGALIEEISLCSLSPNSLTVNPEIIESEIEHGQLQDLIENALTKLKDRQREIIIHRFGLYGETEKTLEKIGQMQGCTRERIRQIEADALKRLRHPAISKELRAALAA
jgi:RNA polymerase sigma factor (sigma-70 family)